MLVNELCWYWRLFSLPNMKMGNSRPLYFHCTTFRNSYLSSADRPLNALSQTSSMKPFFSHIHIVIQMQTRSVENSHTNSYTKNSVNTYTTHTCAHLFEDPTNLSNSALGMLLMGDRGRGWWKCLRPGRIDRLAAPNERQACLRNHEGRAVGLQQRS